MAGRAARQTPRPALVAVLGGPEGLGQQVSGMWILCLSGMTEDAVAMLRRPDLVQVGAAPGRRVLGRRDLTPLQPQAKEQRNAPRSDQLPTGTVAQADPLRARGSRASPMAAVEADRTPRQQRLAPAERAKADGRACTGP